MQSKKAKNYWQATNNLKIMHLQIISPQKELFNGDIYLVQVPGEKGSFEILNNHAPVISTLNKGKIKVIATDGHLEFFEIKDGFVEVKNNEIKILVN